MGGVLASVSDGASAVALGVRSLDELLAPDDADGRAIPVTLGSLFSGIGGFDLGFERAGFEVKWQVEIDDFAAKVLEKHWPTVQRFRDVRHVHACRVCQAGWDACGGCLATVDVLCGGFPCQDISYAGDGAGITGERSGLWSEMARLVGELRPRYVVVENVAALLDRGAGRVLGDLAERGYDAEWRSFPTGRGMGHNRERVFIVAHAMRERLPIWSHADQDGADEARFFTRERFAGVLAGVDPVQRWADRPLLGGGIHGIPNRMDRIRALGNSIVPDVAERIARRILEAG